MTPGGEERPDLAAVLGELLGGKGKGEPGAAGKTPDAPPESGAPEAESADAPETPESGRPEQREADKGEEEKKEEAAPLAGLLSDPALLRALPVVLSLVSSLGGAPQKTAALPAAPKSEGEKRAALLRAVKPYLSPERADAVEIVLKVTELIDLLK